MLEKCVRRLKAVNASLSKLLKRKTHENEERQTKSQSDTEADQSRNHNVGERPLKLVIFDKDGTLISFHAMWAPWCELIASRLEETTGIQLRTDLFQVFCYDPTTGRIGKGSLAEKTQELLRNEVVEMLHYKYRMTHSKAQLLAEDAWDTVSAMTDLIEATVKPVCDVRAVMTELRAEGVKIAICTSDSRDSTMVAVESLGIASLVDRILCGDDPDNVPKPAPDNVRLICAEFGIEPENAAVIGDTPADTEMGQASNAKIVFGVLSGVCTEEDLAPASHHVVDTIQDALPILLECMA